MPAVATRSAALAYVASLDTEGITEMVDALQARHIEIHGEREARNIERVDIGVDVVIFEVEQECLTGLSGKVDHIDVDGYVDVLLDPHSTGRLRFARDPDYPVGSEMRYLLTGVPPRCCFAPGTLPASCCFQPEVAAQSA